MKQGDVQRMLVATNRWWRNPRGWSRDDPDLRDADDAPFRYSAGVLDALAPGGLYDVSHSTARRRVDDLREAFVLWPATGRTGCGRS